MCTVSNVGPVIARAWLGGGTYFTLCDFVHERIELPGYLVDPTEASANVSHAEAMSVLICSASSRQGIISDGKCTWD